MYSGKRSLFLSGVFAVLFFITPLSAETAVTLDSSVYPGVTMSNVEDVTERYTEFPDLFFNTNKEVIPSALALINTIGYPSGRSSIKQFPHLEFGTAVGGGVYEYTRKDSYKDGDPTIPFGGANGGFHVGTGIISGLDITFKVFVFSFESVADDTKKIEGKGDDTEYKFEIIDADFSSFGAKIRHTLVPRRVIFPLGFAFGGISLNLGFDYMKGEMKTYFELTDVEAIEEELTIGTNTYNPYNATLEISGTPEIDFTIYSISPELLFYFDFFYHFTLYTGPSASINFGEFNFNLDADGVLYFGDTDGAQIASANLKSKNKMKPKRMIPKWNVGIEFHLLALKLQVEASSVMTALTESFTGQAGIRFQF